MNYKLPNWDEIDENWSSGRSSHFEAYEDEDISSRLRNLLRTPQDFSYQNSNVGSSHQVKLPPKQEPLKSNKLPMNTSSSFVTQKKDNSFGQESKSSSSSIDSMELRAWLISQVERFNLTVDSLINVKKHIATEVGIDNKVRSTKI
jgi:hypothetical protein